MGEVADWDPVEAFAFAQAIADLNIITLAPPFTGLEANLARGARNVKAFLDPFAIEVALKALLKKTGRIKHGHSLLVLFDQLLPASRSAVEQAWATIAEPSASGPLRELLAAHDKDFVERRYPFERPATEAPADLGSVIDAVRNAFVNALDPTEIKRLAELCTAKLTITDPARATHH